MNPRKLLPATAALLLLVGCGKPGPEAFQGYVEGEYIYLAAPQAGYLQSLDLPRGSRVATGQQVFSIAPEPDSQALAQAEAQAGSAREKLENLEKPRRPPEIATLEAQVRAAETALRLTQTQLSQQEALAKANFVSSASLDTARANRDGRAADLEAARQQLATYQATLGRKAEVRGAAADLAAAAAQADQRRWQLEKKTVAAPTPGEISDTYYRPGEWVGAGQPVASLLPDSRRRLRFFVPETALARFQPGQVVEARCDGCAAPIRARIDFISPQAEYTPPVIYSRGTREKLVFRIEAVPALEEAPRLRPGLPVDVVPVAGS